MIYFVLNLAIAIIWLMLSRERGILDLFVGYAIGFMLLLLFSSVLGQPSYIRRSLAFVVFLLHFLRLFIKSNLQIAYAALARSTVSIHPNFVEYDITGLSKLEALLLSQCITLTPGTTSVDISPDFTMLTIHAFDADDPDALRRDIDQELKERIVQFTR